jgi:hypothetical protein
MDKTWALRMFEERVLRRISGHKMDELIRG